MPVTVDDVKRLHAEQVLAGKSPKDAYNGVRTLVQAAMHADLPSPYPLPPPTKMFVRGRLPTDAEKAAAAELGIPIAVGIELTPAQERAFDQEERDELLARMTKVALSASPEHMAAHASHNVRCHPSNKTESAVHHAQKEHQSALWRQADALVTSVLGGCP
jgi:hypothetical protein